MDSPSQTVQLYPQLWREPLAPGLLRHTVLYGTTDPDGASEIVLDCCAVDEPGAHRRLTRGSADHTDAVWGVCSLTHPSGDVDRLRYCPARPELVAAKCIGAAISLYDMAPVLTLMDEIRRDVAGMLERTVNTAADEEMGGEEAGEVGSGGGGAGTGNGAEDGREDGEGPAGASPAAQGQQRPGTGSCGAGDQEEDPPRGPCSVLQSERQDGPSLAWGHSGDSGGADSHGGLRLFSGMLNGAIGEYAIREGGNLVEVTVRRGGHDGDAEITDLAWSGAAGAAPDGGAGAGGPSGSAVAALALLASAGTDGRTLLWDPRQRLPALRAPRCRKDVNGVAFAPQGGDAGGGPLLANAGDDGIVRVYDVRQLSSSGGGVVGGGGGAGAGAAAGGGSPGGVAHGAPAALQRLKGHMCGVRQLAFSPHSAALLASSDEQGRVILWELGRRKPLQEGIEARPELVFVHAGHVLPVDDFGWSTELYGTLASVSGMLDPAVVEAARADPEGGPELQGQDPAVQVWRPAADMIPPPPSGAEWQTRLRD